MHVNGGERGQVLLECIENERLEERCGYNQHVGRLREAPDEDGPVDEKITDSCESGLLDS